MSKRIDELLGKPAAIFEKFHDKTKIRKLSKNISARYWPKEWTTIYYKGYSRFEEILLPKPLVSGNISLKTSLFERSSRREFSKLPITLSELSTLLYYSAGEKKDKKHVLPRSRFYPSPGARYPLEVYLISRKSELPRGVYHYYIKNHSLERLLSFKKFEFRKYFNQSWIEKSGIIILITAVFKRNAIKYGDRGYRHVLVESGHMAQNFYLLSSALNLYCCGIGGYVDDELNKLIDVDGVEESVVYVLAIGSQPKKIAT